MGPERVKRGSNKRSINTRTCNWRINADGCAAIATRERDKKMFINEVDEWPGIHRCVRNYTNLPGHRVVGIPAEN